MPRGRAPGLPDRGEVTAGLRLARPAVLCAIARSSSCRAALDAGGSRAAALALRPLHAPGGTLLARPPTWCSRPTAVGRRSGCSTAQPYVPRRRSKERTPASWTAVIAAPQNLRPVHGPHRPRRVVTAALAGRFATARPRLDGLESFGPRRPLAAEADAARPTAPPTARPPRVLDSLLLLARRTPIPRPTWRLDRFARHERHQASRRHARSRGSEERPLVIGTKPRAKGARSLGRHPVNDCDVSRWTPAGSRGARVVHVGSPRPTRAFTWERSAFVTPSA